VALGLWTLVDAPQAAGMGVVKGWCVLAAILRALS
jgi:hypothetical protein